MGNYKLPMELIADKKSRFRAFKTREMGMKKKISELCTLCDVKACMIVYGPDGDGPSSSQPRFWPENRYKVECIIEQYMEKRKEDSGMRSSSNLSDVLQIRKKRAKIQPPMLQEKKQSNSLGGLDKLSHEELMEIIDKLDKDLEEVDNLISLKKGETNSMSELSIHCSHVPGSSVIQSLDSHLPIQGIQNVDSDILDDLDFMIDSMRMIGPDELDSMMKSMGETEADGLDSLINFWM